MSEKQFLKQVEMKMKKSDVYLQKGNIADPQQVADVIRQIVGDKIDVCESFVALYMNQKLDIIGWQLISQSGITTTLVDIRILFSSALSCLATSIIVAHNHPSGNLKASESDKKITKDIKLAGELLNIKLLDHLIVTEESYYSFREDGEL